MQTDPLYSLLYTSQALAPFSPEQLERLLDRSRKANDDLEVTGMLVHLSGSFMQVIEGPRDAVRALFYEKISGDARHSAIEVVTEGPIAERQFADWTMAFENLDDGDDTRKEGFSRFVEQGFTTELAGADQSMTVAILGKFRQVFGPADVFREVRDLAS